MGPPGGGRNDITSRFTRHMQIVPIDEFNDDTMTRIFTNIVDWHFAKGFDSSFGRIGKVRDGLQSPENRVQIHRYSKVTVNIFLYLEEHF